MPTAAEVISSRTTALHARPRGARVVRAHRRGFTITDVLVTMAVIAVLMSLLAPSLSSVRQAAHQVVCRSNVRQLGFGIFMYAEHNADRMPSSSVWVPQLTPGADQPWDTVTLRFGPQRGALAGSWDGLGRLYKEDYLPAPKIFYCPAHRGDHKFADAATSWANGDEEEIVGNFQYRACGPTRILHPSSAAAPTTTLLSRIDPNAAIVADSLRTKADFSHQVGANILRANQSVEWYSDTGRVIVNLLPKDSAQAVEAGPFLQVWGHFDGP